MALISFQPLVADEILALLREPGYWAVRATLAFGAAEAELRLAAWTATEILDGEPVSYSRWVLDGYGYLEGSDDDLDDGWDDQPILDGHVSDDGWCYIPGCCGDGSDIRDDQPLPF